MFRYPLCVLVSLSICAVESTLAEPVRIDLRGRHKAQSSVTRIADIARISGGDLITRRKIEQLDLMDGEGTSEQRRITKRQVFLRVLLSGIDEDSFRVLGANSVLLSQVKARTPEAHLLDSLLPHIAKQMRVPSDDIQLELATPLPGYATDLIASDVTIQPILRNEIRSGIVTVPLRLRKNDKLIRTLSVMVEVQRFRNAVVAQQALPKGQIVTADDIRTERRLALGATLPADAVLGKTVRRPIEIGQSITTADLAPTAIKKPEILIKSRDTVEVVARGAGLEATINNAIAMQRGARGDSIRVKNPSSGKILTARVVAPGRVEIRL